MTYSAEVSTPSNNVSTETPSHTVSNLLHFVTPWISRVIVSLGSLRNSAQGPSPWLIDFSGDRTGPGRERSPGRRAGRQNGEVSYQVLAWRNTPRVSFGPGPPMETA